MNQELKNAMDGIEFIDQFADYLYGPDIRAIAEAVINARDNLTLRVDWPVIRDRGPFASKAQAE